jgi:hypothetical protein
LGPPESWPLGLKTAIRLILTSQHPMLIWWGPELIQIYNDAYGRLIGPGNHPRALGRRGSESWSSIWDVIGPQIDYVMAGRGATWQENQMVPLTREGRGDEAYWTYGYSPIDDPDATSGVGGVLVVCAETTDAVLAGIALRRSHARQEFRIELGDALRDLADPRDIMAAAVERLGRHLGVDQANFYVIEDDDFVVEQEWRSEGAPSLIGRHKLAPFGSAVALVRAGGVLRIDDARSNEDMKAFAAAGMAAVLSAPVHRDRRWLAGLHVHQGAPRAWTDDDEALVREVAERA